MTVASARFGWQVGDIDFRRSGLGSHRTAPATCLLIKIEEDKRSVDLKLSKSAHIEGPDSAKTQGDILPDSWKATAATSPMTIAGTAAASGMKVAIRKSGWTSSSAPIRYDSARRRAAAGRKFRKSDVCR